MSEKKVSLKHKEDIVSVIELALSEVKETPTAVALANCRIAGAKVRMRLEDQHMNYLRFKEKHGTSIGDTQEFFGYRTQTKQIEKKS